MSQQPGEPFLLIARQPAVHGIGLAPFQQPVAGDPIGGLALGDLQQCGTPLSPIRARVVVPMRLQFLPLLPTQR